MSSLRDGLGGEEIQVSGVELSGTNAVYIHPYFLGSVTSEDQISGADIYSDGIVHGENIYGDTEVSGATIRATTFSGTDMKLSNDLSVDAISASTVDNGTGRLQTVSAGSDFGAIIQAGSDRLYTNAVWVEFKTPYTVGGSPIISLTNTTMTGSLALWIGSDSIGPGSFQARGLGASDEFNWISVGI